MSLHIVVIPDGNRRWAKKQGLPSVEGHRKGAETFKQLIDWCKEKQVKELSFWACSTENMERSPEEVSFLMKLIEEFCEQYLKEKAKNDKLRINFIGRKDRIPSSVKEKFEEISEETKNYSGHVLNMLVDYGGHQEILSTTKKLVEQGLELNEENFNNNLMLKSKPDLIIRTSEERLSGVLPWQSSYAEIIFLKDKLWPEFNKQDFENCLTEFNNRKRRFGK